MITTRSKNMGLIQLLFAKRTSASGEKKEVVGLIYDFKLNSLEGKEIDFSQYRGKKILIVNTASRCGFTSQYADLERLHEQYGDRVAILGFPANNFFNQEPGSNEQIGAFCQRNYGVKFQMFKKISVKGNDQHPLYKWLASKSGHAPSWNFCKYLIDKDGNMIGFYPSKVNPLNKEIVEQISRG